LVTELAADGMAVLFISAELDEVVRISDRIALMRDGHNIAQLDGGCPVSELTRLIASGSQR